MAENSTVRTPNMSINTGMKILWNKVAVLEKGFAELTGENIDDIKNRVNEKMEKQVKQAQQQVELKVEQKALEQQTKNSIVQMRRVIETQESRINNLEKKFTSLSQEFIKSNNLLQGNVDDKYLKLNNFLVDLQTTQMVMNDKVLKQFDDIVEKKTKGVDASADANEDASADANVDASADANVDASADANEDASADANVDTSTDSNEHASTDANEDASADVNEHASTDANEDATDQENITLNVE